MELDEKGNLIWAVFAKHEELFEPVPHIDLRAEMNCLCAASCDPGSGKLAPYIDYLCLSLALARIRFAQKRLPYHQNAQMRRAAGNSSLHENYRYWIRAKSL